MISRVWIPLRVPWPFVPKPLVHGYPFAAPMPSPLPSAVGQAGVRLKFRKEPWFLPTIVSKEEGFDQ